MRIMPIQFRGLDETHHGGGALTGAQGSGEEPVVALMHGRS